LVDEVEPGSTPVHAFAKLVMFSSPKRDNYRTVLKAIGATIRYMPVWSWHEIIACHTLLYAHDETRPLADVAAAFDRWGGVPRMVLEKLRDEAAQAELDAAVATADVGILVRSAGQVDAAPEASHRLLHMLTQRPYVHKSIAFGSVHIADAVLNRLSKQQQEQLLVTWCA
jgi:hypothetical protein